MTSLRRPALLLALVLAPAAPIAAQDAVLARAAGGELRVEEAARLLVENPLIEPESGAVAALADLWVDYMLLATEAARDPGLRRLDVDRLIAPEREERLIRMLLERAAVPDTVFTPSELAAAWTAQGAGDEVRARHVLLQFPEGATAAQRDSVTRLAERLRARAAAGEDFAALARAHSADPSAAGGGDLGFFGRGRMVAEFEAAAFALQPGQVSPVVETVFGLHVIRVEERRSRPLGDDTRDDFRAFLAGRAREEAARRYADSLSAAAGVRVAPGAGAVVRQLAGTPTAAPGTPPLATWRGGDLSAAEVAGTLAELHVSRRMEAAGLDSAATDAALRGLALRELLAGEAEARRLALTPAQTDSLRADVREALHELLESTGLDEPAPGVAIRDRVRALLREAVAGQRSLAPLGPLGRDLRRQHGGEVAAASLARVAERMRALRAVAPR